MQRAIEEKAKEYGVPVIRTNPRNTSRVCPMHGAEIIYSGRDRRGTCSEGGEVWHRNAVAYHNLLSRALGGDGGDAPSRLRLVPVDGGPVPLGPTAAHEQTPIAREVWASWSPLGAMSDHISRDKRRQPF
jgi:transposase